jgi:Leucine-rich repeat (LRR) protein
MASLELLDLSHNSIEVRDQRPPSRRAVRPAACFLSDAHAWPAAPQVVPRGIFPSTPKLKHVDLSHNSIKSLPDDLAELA